MKSHSTQSLACYCQVAGDLWHIPISDGSLGCKPRGSSNAFAANLAAIYRKG